MIPVSMDYVQQALDKLFYQYRESSNLKELLSSFCVNLGLTQTDTYDIIGSLDLETSTGTFLDLIGKLVNVPRAGRSDDDYRSAIKLSIAFNTSQGTPDKLLEAITLATNATTVRLWETFPLGARYYTDGQAGFSSNVADRIREASPITAEQVVLYYNYDADSVIIPTEQGQVDTSAGVLSEYTYGLGSGTLKNTDDNTALCEIQTSTI